MSATETATFLEDVKDRASKQGNSFAIRVKLYIATATTKNLEIIL